VFVFLNDASESPEYFILTGQEILEQKSHFYGTSIGSNRETINYGPLKSHKNLWDKLDL